MKFERTKQTTNQVLFADYNAVQAEIFWIKNLGAYDPKLEATVDAFNGYFGGGMGTIVFNVIRESKALAYSTYAFMGAPSKKDDCFRALAYIGCQADKMNDAIVGMNELLNNMPKDEPKFENVRSSLLKGIETERIAKSDIIPVYLQAQRKGLDYDLRKDKYTKYRELQFKDIANLHQTNLANQAYTYCVIGSDKKINLDDLKKYGEVKVLNLETLFGY